MIWLKIIGKILKTLKDGATPGQIAGGFVLGFSLGLMPGWPPQVWLVVILILILQVNLNMAIVGALLSIVLGWIFDPALDALGDLILSIGALRETFTGMYNSPPWTLTRFNNTVMMGGFAASVVGAVVFFPLIVKAVKYYREKFLGRLSKFKIVQMIMGSKWGSKVFGFYSKLQDLGLV